MDQPTPALASEGRAADILAGDHGSGVVSNALAYAMIAGSALVAGVALAAVGGFSFVAFLVVTAMLATSITYSVARVIEGRRQAFNGVMMLAIGFAFAFAILPLISLLYEVVHRGLNRFDADFFTQSARGVVGEGGGASHAILGTLIITGIASVISVPVGLMAAIYLNEYGTGRLRRALTFFVDVMTGIPSIVAGLFAYALFELFLGPGIRLGIMGSIALSVLMIPIVIRSAEEILKIVPNHLREAAYALGTPKWKTITKVVLPTALAGLVTGVMLAIARVIGETAPLLVTTGVVDSVNTESVRRPHAEPRGVRVQRIQEPRSAEGGSVRPRMGRSLDLAPDRDGPQLDRALGVPPLWNRHPLKPVDRKLWRHA